MWKVDRGTELTVRKRRAFAAKLDRLTTRFAWAVIAATGVLFAFHGVRILIQSGALS